MAVAIARCLIADPQGLYVMTIPAKGLAPSEDASRSAAVTSNQFVEPLRERRSIRHR